MAAASGGQRWKSSATCTACAKRSACTAHAKDSVLRPCAHVRPTVDISKNLGFFTKPWA
jgi:hypothetical protein